MVAGTQGKLSDSAQLQALTGAGALTKAGAERQGYQQSLLDQPLKTATAASGLMRGYTMPGSQTSTFTGPKAGAYQTSDLSQILNAMSAVGSVAGGKGLETITGLGKSLSEYLGGVLSNNKNLSGAYNVDANEFVGQNAGGTPIYWDTTSGKYYDTQGNIVPITRGEGE